MHFKTADFFRKSSLQLLNSLTKEQLCYIPKGFNNHILWNIGHLLITEQMLTYGLSNLELSVDSNFKTLYGKGSQPKSTVTNEEIEDIKNYLIPAIKNTERDLKKGVFKTYNEYTTSPKITLHNVEEALNFNILHEGIHFGIILSIKKTLK
jgi:hypothetical protein